MSVVAEAIAQTAEFDRVHEEALFAQRLYDLQQEAGQGLHTPEPVHFLAGIELEFQIFDDPFCAPRRTCGLQRSGPPAQIR